VSVVLYALDGCVFGLGTRSAFVPPNFLFSTFPFKESPVSTLLFPLLSAVSFLSLGVAFGITFMTDDSTPAALQFALLWLCFGFITGLVAIIADKSDE
jgi:sorbitol-specific phosphotransferase system component IIC